MSGPIPPQAAGAAAEFRDFVDRTVLPIADDLHRRQRTPPEVIDLIAARGYLGLPIPRQFGGGGHGPTTVGLLAAELGRGCSSLRSLLTVHTMVAHAIARWGTRAQKETYLPELASGRAIAALAISEPRVGSDIGSLAARAVLDGGDLVLTGHKAWTTYGQVASLFLVFARAEQGPTAYLVDRASPGFHVEPVAGLLGLRASMMANVHLDGCRVPADRVVGRPGLGTSHVAATALDVGRYTVAWGCVGILDACVEASIGYTRDRQQFGVPLKEHQLVRKAITDMMTGQRAARLLCLEAARLRETGDPGALAATSVAKYFASTAAFRAASDAIQLHGANAVTGDHPLQRYLGDAKIMEIIEGSSQIQQITIAEYGYQDHGALRPRAGAEGGGPR